MTCRLRGIFLTSDRPEETARFYEGVAGLPLEIVEAGTYRYWRLDRDGMQLAIHDAAVFSDYTHPPMAGSNLTHLYFKIEDRPAFLTHLEQQERAPYAVDDVVVTVIDPDGRKVMFGTA